MVFLLICFVSFIHVKEFVVKHTKKSSFLEQIFFSKQLKFSIIDFMKHNFRTCFILKNNIKAINTYAPKNDTSLYPYYKLAYE